MASSTDSCEKNWRKRIIFGAEQQPFRCRTFLHGRIGVRGDAGLIHGDKVQHYGLRQAPSWIFASPAIKTVRSLLLRTKIQLKSHYEIHNHEKPKVCHPVNSLNRYEQCVWYRSDVVWFFDVQGSSKDNVNFSLRIHEYINDWIKNPIPRLAIASSFHYQYWMGRVLSWQRFSQVIR